MGWTYSGNPSTSTRDQVRFELGDTDSSDPQLQDAEIDYLLTQAPDPLYAAACGCDALAAKFSRQAQKSVGNVSIAANQRASAYRDRALELRQKALRMNGVTITFGGLTYTDKQSNADDTNAVQPNFTIGMDDTTGTATIVGSNPLVGRV